MTSRAVETVIGVAVSLVLTFLTHADDASPEDDDEEFLDAVAPDRT